MQKCEQTWDYPHQSWIVSSEAASSNVSIIAIKIYPEDENFMKTEGKNRAVSDWSGICISAQDFLMAAACLLPDYRRVLKIQPIDLDLFIVYI
jgi:hypothetical protein